MSRVIPIINEGNKTIISVESDLSTLLINNQKKITPVINEDKKQVSLTESNLPTLSNNNFEDFTPILDDNNNLILQIGGSNKPGPPGKKGEPGNGILKIEKTGTSNLIDTYTIFFTNGDTFEYQITNGVVYYYNGPYEVIPMPYTSQILPTANLAMSTDLTVGEIPFFETSNLSGGKTATIGII